MDQLAFEQSCVRDGFEGLEEKQGTAGFISEMHTHPFSARIMITGGEFTITRDGGTEVFGAGGSFTMESGCEHAESFGADGATFLVARKHAAAS
jgi:quercetin dioxygenase-like cupin family protein